MAKVMVVNEGVRQEDDVKRTMSRGRCQEDDVKRTMSRGRCQEDDVKRTTKTNKGVTVIKRLCFLICFVLFNFCQNFDTDDLPIFNKFDIFIKF